MVKISPNDLCPCDSGLKYKKCCRPYHTGNKQLPTPEALVRARYAAYALEDIEFIMRTTHPESPHFDQNRHRWQSSLSAYCFRNLFPKLEILSANDDQVTFCPHILEFGAQKHAVTEHSAFKQVDGRWLYYDSVMEKDTDQPQTDSSE